MKVHKLMIITLTAMLLMASLIVIVPNELSADAGQEPWLDGWRCRKSHVINASAGAGTGYVVGIKVYNGTGTDGTETINGVSFGKVYINSTTADFREVRFTDNDAVTLLPYWIESYSAGAYAVIWVKVADDLSTSPATIYIYWNNPAAFPMSNGDVVFEQFDDFEDSNVWSKEGLVIPTPSTDWVYAEPTVIVESGAKILDVPATTEVFKMWYRTEILSTGVTSIRYTESINGYDWESPLTVLSTGEGLFCPFVMKNQNTYYMYVHAGWPYVDCWTSSDGLSWTKAKDNALTVGSSGQWDAHALGNYFIWTEGPQWYMIYEAKPEPGKAWRLGLATSSDGLDWVKDVDNPCYGSDSANGGGPFVTKVVDTYYMIFHGGLTGQLPTDLYLATSTNLKDWTLVWDEPVLPRTEVWEGYGESEGQVGDLHIVSYKNQLYGFYEAVRTQSDHRGIALLGTGLTIEQLMKSRQNKPYSKSDRWLGDLAQWSITNGVATFTGVSGAYNYTWMNSNAAGNTAMVFNGAFLTLGASDKVMVIGYNDVSRDDFCQINKGSVEVHRVQVTEFASAAYDIDESDHRYELRRDTSGSKMFVDGTQRTEITTQIYNNASLLMIQCYDASIRMNGIFVRPYIASEPVHSTWTQTDVWVPYAEGEEPGTWLISPSLLDGMIELIFAVMLLMIMVSIIGMVKVKKR